MSRIKVNPEDRKNRIKDLFRKFGSHSDDSSAPYKMEREIIYCLIQAPMEKYAPPGPGLLQTWSEIFQLVCDNNGDVNQFCGDILLVLFGVPIEDENASRHLNNFLSDLSKIDKPLKAVIGKDKALYGSFGCKDRQVVSALSQRLAKDLHRIDSLADGHVQISSDLIESLPSIKTMENFAIDYYE